MYASPDPSGKRLTPGMHEPYWNPLYEKCQSMSLPIIVHGTNMLDPRFRAFSANYQLGFVIEQFLATHFLSNSDVFDRFPELRVLVCHCGGALSRFVRTARDRDTSKNLFFDTCSYETNLLEAAIKQRGVDQVCFGSEAPGAGGAIRPETSKSSDDMVPVIDSFGFLSAEDKTKIFNHNAVRVFPGLTKVAG
jgi:predicted TIM-barrel fold metal-dependent hydrolase